MAKLPPTTFIAGDFVIGFDPGHDDEQAAAVVMQKHKDGRIEVLSVEHFEIDRRQRHPVGKVIPFHFARECSVCENDRVVVLAAGPHVDLFDCPACIGLRQSDLTSWEIEDVEAMCAEHGMKPRWS